MPILLVGLALLLSSCQTPAPGHAARSLSTAEVAAYRYSIPPADEHWPTASADPDSLDIATLEEGVRAIMAGDYPGVHSVLIAQRGALVFEEYSFHGELTEYDRHTRHRLASLSKSVTALVVGIAVDWEEVDLDSSVLA